jgi:hypothetical protein
MAAPRRSSSRTVSAGNFARSHMTDVRRAVDARARVHGASPRRGASALNVLDVVSDFVADARPQRRRLVRREIEPSLVAAAEHHAPAPRAALRVIGGQAQVTCRGSASLPGLLESCADDPAGPAARRLSDHTRRARAQTQSGWSAGSFSTASRNRAGISRGPRFRLRAPRRLAAAHRAANPYSKSVHIAQTEAPL